MAQVVTGRVLHEAVIQIEHGAGAGDHFQSGHPVARETVADHADAAGIRRDVAADLARPGRREVDRIEQAAFRRVVLQRLGNDAGLTPHDAIGFVEIENAVHAIERHDDLAVRCDRTARQSRSAAGRHERPAPLVRGSAPAQRPRRRSPERRSPTAQRRNCASSRGPTMPALLRLFARASVKAIHSVHRSCSIEDGRGGASIGAFFAGTPLRHPMSQTSFDKDKIKILLLEGVHASALERLSCGGIREHRTQSRRTARRRTRARAGRRAHPRHPQPHATHRGGARGSAAADRGGLLLHRYESGRIERRDVARRAGVQRAVLEHAQRR